MNHQTMTPSDLEAMADDSFQASRYFRSQGNHDAADALYDLHVEAMDEAGRRRFVEANAGAAQ
jgi:hypothetical protein